MCILTGVNDGVLVWDVLADCEDVLESELYRDGVDDAVRDCERVPLPVLVLVRDCDRVPERVRVIEAVIERDRNWVGVDDGDNVSVCVGVLDPENEIEAGIEFVGDIDEVKVIDLDRVNDCVMDGVIVFVCVIELERDIDPEEVDDFVPVWEREVVVVID